MLDDLLAQLYPRDGKRGPIPFPPDATALYLAWRARRLMAQGFACEDAFATLAARFGPAAQLPGRSDRTLAKLDDLIRRVRSEEGWTVPYWLGPASTHQAHTYGRAMRRTAQRKMLTRLAKLSAKLTGDECSACGGSGTVDAEVCPACDGSGSALMAAALRDRLIHELAVSAAPIAMRPRGRPRKGAAPRLTDAARTNDETAEAVVRYLLTCAD